eukprot:g10222.t1
MHRDESLARSHQIDRICDEFDQARRAGKARRIEDLLAENPGVDRARLLRELLLIELEIRHPQGESASADDYAARFPNDTDVVDAAVETILLKRDRAAIEETVDVVQNADDGETYVPGDEAGQQTVVPGASTSPDLPASGGPGGRQFGDYELLHEIARGGMGVVYKARQNKLNRIVALKMIKAGELAGDEEVKRFHAEAEAAAALDHPGIVPIYEVGEWRAGGVSSPVYFFSMGFVDGQGLDARLKEGPLPPRDAAELIKTIAEAVHYAHDKGIVHRDLKPANVLLANDGADAQATSDATSESALDDATAIKQQNTAARRLVPKITDFGLAKNIAADSGMTATGQVMGTPSYMPPEQAAGKIEQVGPLADVYSLGAMLYATLTGRPPFQAANVIETLKHVLEREPVSPSQLNPAVDKDLETICLKCLQKDASKRYDTARGLAGDLECYLAGKPISARPISRPARLWRWCKRNPLGATVAGLILFLAIAGPMVAAIQIDTNRRLDTALTGEKEATATAEAKERETAAALVQVELALANEQAALKRKDKALLETEKSIDAYVEVVKNAELLKDPRFKPLLKDLLKEALAHYERFIEEHRDEQDEKTRVRMAQAFFEIGQICSEKGSKDKAVEAYLQALEIRKQLARESPESTKYQRDIADVHNNLGVIYKEIGKLPDALSSYHHAVQIYEHVMHANPKVTRVQSGLAHCHQNIGILYRETGKMMEALSSFQKGLKIREHLARAYPARANYQNDWASSHGEIGSLHHKTGNRTAALASYRRALEIRKRLARVNPTVNRYQYNLALSHQSLGQFYFDIANMPKSVAEYRQALKIQSRLVDEHPTITEFQISLATCYKNLGVLYGKTGNAAEALASYQQSLRIREQLVRENSNVLIFQSQLASSIFSLGIHYSQTGNTVEALASYRRALRIHEQLARKNPKLTIHQSRLADNHNTLGVLYRQTGKTAEALASTLKALKIRERLVRESPSTTEYQNDLATSHWNLGILYADANKPADALSSYQRGLKIHERLVRENPTVALFQERLAGGIYNIGLLYATTGKLAKAMASLKKALPIQERLTCENPTVTVYRRRLALTHQCIGYVFQQRKQSEEALEHFRMAAEVDFTNRGHHIRLGHARQQVGRYEESVSALDDALRLDPKSEQAYRYRGVSFQQLGRLKAALHDLDRAVELAPKQWRTHYARGKILNDLKRFDEAVNCFDRVVELNPRYAWGYYYRGLTQSHRGRFKRARRDLEDAWRMGATISRIANSLAWLLATCPDESIRNGKLAVQLATRACKMTKWKSANCLGTLAAAHAENGDFESAVKWQKEAQRLYSPELKQRWAFLLQLYKSGKPYRQPLPAETQPERRLVFDLTNAQIESMGRHVLQQAYACIGSTTDMFRIADRIAERLAEAEAVLNNATPSCTLGQQLLSIRAIDTEPNFHLIQTLSGWLETMSRLMICETHFRVKRSIVAIQPKDKIVLDASFVAESRLSKFINVRRALMETDFQPWTVCRDCARAAGLRQWQVQGHIGGRVFENRNGPRAILFGVGFNPDQSHIAAMRAFRSISDRNAFSTKLLTGQLTLPQNVADTVFSHAHTSADEKIDAHATFMKEALSEATRRLRQVGRRVESPIDSRLKGLAFSDSNGRPMSLIMAPAEVSGLRSLIKGTTVKLSFVLGIVALLLAIWLGQIPVVQEHLPPTVVASAPKQFRWIGWWSLLVGQVCGGLVGLIFGVRLAAAGIGWHEFSDVARARWRTGLTVLVGIAGIVALWVPAPLSLSVRVGATILVALVSFWIMPLTITARAAGQSLSRGVPRSIWSIMSGVTLLAVALTSAATLESRLGLGMAYLLAGATLAAVTVAFIMYRILPADFAMNDPGRRKFVETMRPLTLFWCSAIVPVLGLLTWFLTFSEVLLYRILLSLAALASAPFVGAVIGVVVETVVKWNHEAQQHAPRKSPGGNSAVAFGHRQLRLVKRAAADLKSWMVTHWYRSTTLLFGVLALCGIWMFLDAGVASKLGLSVSTASLAIVVVRLKDVSATPLASIKSIDVSGLAICLFGALFAWGWSDTFASPISKGAITVAAGILSAIVRTFLDDLQGRDVPFSRIRDGAAISCLSLFLPTFAIPFIWEQESSLLLKLGLSALAVIVLGGLGFFIGLWIEFYHRK